MNNEIMNLIKIFSINGECNRGYCLQNIMNAFSVYDQMDNKMIEDYNNAIQVLMKMTDEEYLSLDFNTDPIKVLELSDELKETDNSDTSSISDLEQVLGIGSLSLDLENEAIEIIDISPKGVRDLKDISDKKKRGEL